MTNRLNEWISEHYSSGTHLHDRVHEAVCSRHVDQSRIVPVVGCTILSVCCYVRRDQDFRIVIGK